MNDYEDPNEIGAKLIKAELMGDEELVTSLKARLEAARQKTSENKSSSSNKTLTFENKPKNKYQNRHDQNQNRRHTSNQESKKYDFDYEQMKILSGNNYNGDEYDDYAIDSATMPSKKKMKKSLYTADNGTLFEKFVSTKPSSSIACSETPKSENKTIDHCSKCFENAEKHLVVSVGKHAYLSLPSLESLVENYCLITPMQHYASSITCDEDVWKEIEEFKNALVKMFEKKRIELIFYEHFSKQNANSHMVVHCVPLCYDVSNLAPIYFKKAINESESEWAQNKQIISLKRESIRKAIPKNMSFFAVNFSVDDGFAHIIEKEEAFPLHFANEVLGGILDLNPMIWRRPKKDDFSKQSKKVIEFSKWWKIYDFNSQSDKKGDN